MSDGQDHAETIRSGRAILGIELGSTRIKASLIARDTTPLASGSHGWENRLRDGVWTYDMEEVWKGLAACYASLVDDVRERYSLQLTRVAAMGVSGMMHGYVALDAQGELLVPFRTWRNNITGEACAELLDLDSPEIGEPGAAAFAADDSGNVAGGFTVPRDDEFGGCGHSRGSFPAGGQVGGSGLGQGRTAGQVCR